jgi:hypothetical protein
VTTRTVSLRAAALALGVSPATLGSHARAGSELVPGTGLRAVRVGARRWVVPAAALDRIIDPEARGPVPAADAEAAYRRGWDDAMAAARDALRAVDAGQVAS